MADVPEHIKLWESSYETVGPATVNPRQSSVRILQDEGPTARRPLPAEQPIDHSPELRGVRGEVRGGHAA